jgi:NADPH-dependent glutamate synthase beta subunit-like oxidoreductase
MDVPMGERVVIAGGDDMALDAAKKCMQSGAEQVTVLYRRSQKEVGLTDSEVAQLSDQSIVLHFRATLSQFKGVDDQLTQLVYRQTASDNGSQAGWSVSRRFKETAIAVDTVITASGRLPEMIFVKVPGLEGEDTPLLWQTILPYHEPARTKPEGFFAPTEPMSDYRAAVEAIGAGRRSASSINLYLSGKQVVPPENMITAQTEVLDVNQIVELLPVGPRQKMPERPAAERIDPSLEVELGMTEEMVRNESVRCLNCGLICYVRSKYH